MALAVALNREELAIAKPTSFAVEGGSPDAMEEAGKVVSDMNKEAIKGMGLEAILAKATGGVNATATETTRGTAVAPAAVAGEVGGPDVRSV